VWVGSCPAPCTLKWKGNSMHSAKVQQPGRRRCHSSIHFTFIFCRRRCCQYTIRPTTRFCAEGDVVARDAVVVVPSNFLLDAALTVAALTPVVVVWGRPPTTAPTGAGPPPAPLDFTPKRIPPVLLPPTTVDDGLALSCVVRGRGSPALAAR
jgi:hypothetical protein